VIKILANIPHIDIVKSYGSISKHIIWTDYKLKSKQAGLQHKEGDDIWISSVGKSKGEEYQYNIINPVVKNTLFEDIIVKYNLARSRFLFLAPFSTYSIHKDSTKRLHIPIITNSKCFLLFKENGLHHLAPGHVYETDTTLEHTSINCSESWRLHFVGAIIDN